MDMWNCVIAGRAYDWSVEDLESIESMRSRLHGAGRAFLDEIKRVVNEARLDETFIDTHSEPVEVFTYGALIAHVLTSAAHRRLLVLGALESAGFTSLGYGDPGNGWPRRSDRAGQGSGPATSDRCYTTADDRPTPPRSRHRGRQSHVPRPASP